MEREKAGKEAEKRDKESAGRVNREREEDKDNQKGVNEKGKAVM